MSAIVENVQMVCAMCRIGLYTICCKLCCKGPSPPRPEVSLICLGLSGAGKTTLLSALANEGLDDIQPTTGFLIKCCQFKNCILNIKEVGGGENVRKFWAHYYSGMSGLVFVVNSSASDDELEKASDVFRQVLEDRNLASCPCLVLANFQDKPGARSEQEITEALECEVFCQGRQWAVHTCSMKDVEKLREGIQTKFTQFLIESPGAADTNSTVGGGVVDSNRV